MNWQRGLTVGGVIAAVLGSAAWVLSQRAAKPQYVDPTDVAAFLEKDIVMGSPQTRADKLNQGGLESLDLTFSIGEDGYGSGVAEQDFIEMVGDLWEMAFGLGKQSAQSVRVTAVEADVTFEFA